MKTLLFTPPLAPKNWAENSPLPFSKLFAVDTGEQRHRALTQVIRSLCRADDQSGLYEVPVSFIDGNDASLSELETWLARYRCLCHDAGLWCRVAFLDVQQ